MPYSLTAPNPDGSGQVAYWNMNEVEVQAAIDRLVAKYRSNVSIVFIEGKREGS